jgi:hypothetical protein
MDINIFAIIQHLWNAFVASPFFHFLKAFGIFAFFILLIADVLLLSKRVLGDWKVALYGAKIPSIKKSKYVEQWEKIKQGAASSDLSKAKVAMIEGDQMLGNILEKIGYQGKDTGEKIALVRPGQLIGLEEAKQSHDVFKKVIHNSEYEIGAQEIQTALEGYEKVFRGLELFD